MNETISKHEQALRESASRMEEADTEAKHKTKEWYDEVMKESGWKKFKKRLLEVFGRKQTEDPYLTGLRGKELEIIDGKTFIVDGETKYRLVKLDKEFPEVFFSTKNKEFVRLEKNYVKIHEVTQSDLDPGKDYMTVESKQDKLTNKAYLGDILITNCDQDGNQVEDQYVFEDMKDKQGNPISAEQRAAKFHQIYEKVTDEEFAEGNYYRRKEEIEAVKVHEPIAFYREDWQEWFFVEKGGVVTRDYGINPSSLEMSYHEVKSQPA